MVCTNRKAWSMSGFASSSNCDNLNTSIHLRALLMDLFLLSEIANTQRSAAKPMASGG
jgi:hypothetical protein